MRKLLFFEHRRRVRQEQTEAREEDHHVDENVSVLEEPVQAYVLHAYSVQRLRDPRKDLVILKVPEPRLLPEVKYHHQQLQLCY